jgi:tripartite-type tricarboxylate transporter receptor subunit TctC
MNNGRAVTTVLVSILLLGLWSGLGLAQSADKVAQFYKGKTMTWVVSAEPGGSTDVIARILVPHLARETGTKIAVKNMTGGSMEGDNWTFNEAKPDGLTLLTEGTGPLLLNDLLKSAGVQYVTEKFIFLAGAMPELTIGAVSPKLPQKTFDALRKAKGLKIGASSAKGYLALSGAVATAILGLDARVLTGYKGQKSVLLAVTQGEVDMIVASEPDVANSAKAGDVVPLFVLGDERSSLLPNLQTLKELGVTIPADLVGAYKAVSTNSKSIVLPPGVPEERVAFLRGIFSKMNTKKAVQDDIKRFSGIWRPMIPGEKLQEEIRVIMGNKALGAQMDGLMKKYGAVR